MNANEISLKSNARIMRVRKIILIVRVLMALTVATVVVISLLLSANIFWDYNLPHWIVGLPFTLHTAYRPPFNELPTTIIILGFIRTALCFTGIFILNKLLLSCSSGAFFVAGNAGRLKWIGCLLIADWIVTKLLDWIATKIIYVDFAELALGFLIILIAWIMDEGRKIQEEQELTV